MAFICRTLLHTLQLYQKRNNPNINKITPSKHSIKRLREETIESMPYNKLGMTVRYLKGYYALFY